VVIYRLSRMDLVADHFNPQDEHNGVALSADLHLAGALHKRSREPSSERLKYPTTHWE
jgi:hypothetical protein